MKFSQQLLKTQPCSCLRSIRHNELYKTRFLNLIQFSKCRSHFYFKEKILECHYHSCKSNKLKFLNRCLRDSHAIFAFNWTKINLQNTGLRFDLVHTIKEILLFSLKSLPGASTIFANHINAFFSANVKDRIIRFTAYESS
jgi:hypothetical protein